jgi:hypothetical protein
MRCVGMAVSYMMFLPVYLIGNEINIDIPRGERLAILLWMRLQYVYEGICKLYVQSRLSDKVVCGPTNLTLPTGVLLLHDVVVIIKLEAIRKKILPYQQLHFY